MGKTTQLKAARGLRNDVTAERFKLEDLAVANNVDIDKTGHVLCRLGTARISGVASDSLWGADNGLMFVRQGTTLYQFMPDQSLVALAHGVTGQRVAYTDVDDTVFWSDNIQTGCVQSGNNRLWGINPPGQLTVAQIAGQLDTGTTGQGTYLCTSTFVRASGVESGAPVPTAITLTGPRFSAGLSFTNLPTTNDPTVVSLRIYVTPVNGELPFRVAEVAVGTQVLTVTQLPQNMSLRVRTLLGQPAPPGNVLGNYNGRSYSGQGKYLMYSDPYEYELFCPAKNFMMFPSDVRTFSAVEDGIFLGCDAETLFLQGGGPEDFAVKRVANYGTVLGTETYVPGSYLGAEGTIGLLPMWVSQRGICWGNNGGQMTNLTGNRFTIPAASVGASLLKIRNESAWLVSTLFS